MYSIYNSSIGVCCWIGSGNEHVSVLFDFIKSFVAHAKEVYRLSELAKDEESIERYETASEKFKQIRSSICVSYKEAQNTPLFFGIGSLHQRSYWDRVWVLQELRAVNNRFIICGQDQIDYEDLMSFMMANHTLDRQAKLHSSGDHIYVRSWIGGFLGKLMDQMHVVIGGNDMSALEILCDGLPFLATDPKDKVFALIGLSDQLRDLVPAPDYSQTTAEVYTNVASAILSHTKSLDLLYYCFGQACESGIPSWVPDWSSAERPWWRSQFRSASRFQATREMSSWFEHHSGHTSLKVKGVIIDTIDSVADYHDLSLLEMANGFRQSTPPDTWEQDYGTDNFFLTYPYSIWRQWCDMANECSSEPWAAGKNVEADQLWHLFNAVLSNLEFHQGYSVWREILEHEKLSPVQRARYIATIDKVIEFNDHLTRLAGLTICKTVAARLAFVPHAAREGDKLALIAGCSLPFTVRPVPGGFSLIGASYVQGIMQGEALTDTPDQFETIVLIGVTEVDKNAKLDS